MVAFSAVDDEVEVDILLKALADQFEIEYPGRQVALGNLARSLAKKIVDAEKSPSVGSQLICETVIHRAEGELCSDISIFEALSSEYDDFSGVGNKEFYGEQKCMLEVQRIESEIIAASNKLIL